MNSLYLISENTLDIAKQHSKEDIVLFISTYKKNINNNEFKTITSAQIADYILQCFDCNAGSDNYLKASEICQNITNDNDIFLIYSDTIIDNNLEKKTLIIIEENDDLNKIDAQKIYCIPPSPIIIEYLHNQFPNKIIKTFTQDDDLLFKMSYFYENIKYED